MIVMAFRLNLHDFTASSQNFGFVGSTIRALLLFIFDMMYAIS